MVRKRVLVAIIVAMVALLCLSGCGRGQQSNDNLDGPIVKLIPLPYSFEGISDKERAERLSVLSGGDVLKCVSVDYEMYENK